ncbi:hypothetical protein GCM10022207_60860 [Streptomyces lannensis]|uniref:Uncharacterized protein n=1 Tax=Streptomyces lannensis TaxID=766498 RepID=A0ABP7KQ80_9ACTN
MHWDFPRVETRYPTPVGAAVTGAMLRRIVLRERDRPGAANIGLIGLTARYSLDAGLGVSVSPVGGARWAT